MSWAPALQFLGGLGIVLTIAGCIDWRHRRKNRRVNLPPPSHLTVRSPDWRRYELHTPRKYIP